MQDLIATELLAMHSKSPIRPSDQHLNSSKLTAGRPLQKDNWGDLQEQCVLDPEAFQQLVEPIQVWYSALHANIPQCRSEHALIN